MEFSNLINYFIPDKVRELDGDDYYMSKALVIICFSVGLIILVFLANRIRLNGLISIYSISLSTAAIAIFAIPFLMKVMNNFESAAQVLILILAALIMILTYTTGGPFSPSLVFIPAFPLGGILFVSYRFGGLLMLLLTTHLGFLVWANETGRLPPLGIENSTLGPLHVATTFAVAIVFAILAIQHTKWQKDMREKLQVASETKSEFLSGMSHELRTPLNAIMGFSELLHRGMAGELTQKQKDYAGNIFSSSSHMLSLVNDLLDIAKIEAGQHAINLEPVDLENVIVASTQMVNENAAKKQLRVENELEKSITGCVASVDSVKFKQILLNLLSNAIKFTPDGSTIRLKAGIVNEEISISVADEGSGIAPEDREKIFDKFYQVHHQGDNLSTGTGLGLPISRYFAELHGGTLELVTSPGNTGACFVLTIPFISGGEATLS